jgi:hypothetical protein
MNQKLKIIINENMKKILLILVLALGLETVLQAQDLSKDYVVVDQSAPELGQIKTQYFGQVKVYFNDNAKPAPYIIMMMLYNNTAVDLHLFVATQPGELEFNSVTITAGNAGGFTQFFKEWKSRVSGKVVIHSTNVFSTPAGKALENQLEALTGLDFITP